MRNTKKGLLVALVMEELWYWIALLVVIVNRILMALKFDKIVEHILIPKLLINKGKSFSLSKIMSCHSAKATVSYLCRSLLICPALTTVFIKNV